MSLEKGRITGEMSMNSKLNLVFVFTASIMGLVLFQNTLFAQDVLPSRAIEIQGLLLPTLQNEWKLVNKIEEAKQLLESSAPLGFNEDPKKDKRALNFQ